MTHLGKRKLPLKGATKALERPPRNDSPTVKTLFAKLAELQVSQSSLAKSIFLSPSQISQWKSGYRDPTITDMEDAFAVLGYRIVIMPIQKGERK